MTSRSHVTQGWQICRGWCVYVCLYEAAGFRPHTPLVITSLPTSPLQEVMSQEHHHLLSTDSLPVWTPLVTSRSTVGGSAVLQKLFDPFHIRRDRISQLEFRKAVHVRLLSSKWTKSQFKSQRGTVASNRAGFGSSWKTLSRLYYGTPHSLAP